MPIKKRILFLFCCCFCLDSNRAVFAGEPDESRIECPPPNRQKLILDLTLTFQGSKNKILSTLLGQDKIRTLGTETDFENFKQLRIELSESEFRKVFSGSMKYKLVEKSSGPGQYCHRYIQNYTIPTRYKKYIRTMKIPDPQLE
jgi:hypothetical protein